MNEIKEINSNINDIFQQKNNTTSITDLINNYKRKFEQFLFGNDMGVQGENPKSKGSTNKLNENQKDSKTAIYLKQLEELEKEIDSIKLLEGEDSIKLYSIYFSVGLYYVILLNYDKAIE